MRPPLSWVVKLLHISPVRKTRKSASLLRRLVGPAMVGVATAAVSPIPAAAQSDRLIVYPAPPVPQVYALHNDAFTVRVRVPGGVWQDLYEYRIRVDWDDPQSASLVYFDGDGPLEIEVQRNNGAFRRVSAAPLSTRAKLKRVAADRVLVLLDRPESFSLQFDDDRLHNLHILAGRPPAAPPPGTATRYFGPGVHVPPDGRDTFTVRSGDRIHLDGGAILTGAFDLDGVSDVTIEGRGLLYDPGTAIDLNRTRRVTIRDLILVNTERKAGARVMNIRNSQDVSVQDVAGFTAGKWADGFNISTSRHVAIDRAYLRTSDDAIVVYAVTDCPTCAVPIPSDGPPGAAQPADTFDIRVSNTRIWADVAHGLYVGHFGDLARPRTIRDVTFSNIDIANLDEDDPAWEGAVAVFSGDRTRIENVVFSDIRVDRIEEGKLINIVAGYNPRYNKAAGAGIDGVVIRDVSFTGTGMPSSSLVSGLSPDVSVENVTIDNLRIAGRPIRSFGAIGVVGQHVRGLTLRR